MLRQTSKGWLAFILAGGLLITISGLRAATAAEPLDGKLIAAADSAGASAQAMPEASAQAPNGDAGAKAAGNNTGEKISVTFEEPEKDIMTKQALDKLDVIIESLEFANADLRNVIRIIGERLNINFIFDASDIEGKVTLRLRNVRLKDALDSILTTRKLVIVPDRSGIFRIVPQGVVGKKIIETRTEVIQLNWVSAMDLQKTLLPFLSDDVGRMQANEESNSLIITDVPPQIDTIKRLLLQIDQPERQVQIEARLVDVNIGALRKLGTQWSVTKLNQNAIVTQTSRVSAEGADVYTGTRLPPSAPGEQGDLQKTLIDTVTKEAFLGGQSLGKTITSGLAGVAGADVVPLSNAGGLVPVLLEGFTMEGGQGSLSFGDKIGIFGDTYDLNATFSALESESVVQILANPRVTTLNNVPASIKIIQKIPYIESVSGPSQGTTTGEVEFEEAGVEIIAKPIITPNGFVRLEIKLEQRINRGPATAATIASPLPPPLIDVRKADTNVIVPDSNTVVLGGLREVDQNQRIDGLPWLHRIPVFGWLFKNKSYDQSKLELILMMTPRIIKDEVKLTEHEKYWYDKIDTDWHLPDYFFDETKSITDPPEAKKAGYVK